MLAVFLLLLGLMLLFPMNAASKSAPYWWRSPNVTWTGNMTPKLTGESHVAFRFIWFNYDGGNSCFDSGTPVWLIIDNQKVLNLSDLMDSALSGWSHRIFRGNTNNEDRADDLRSIDGQFAHATFTGKNFKTGSITFSDPAKTDHKAFHVVVDICLEELMVGQSHTIQIYGKWKHKDGSREMRGPKVTMGAPNVTMPSSAGTIESSGNRKAKHTIENLEVRSGWVYSVGDFMEKPKTGTSQDYWSWESAYASKRWAWFDSEANDPDVEQEFSITSNYYPTTVYPRLRRWSDPRYAYNPKGGTTRRQLVGYNKDYAPITIPGFARPKDLKVNVDSWSRKVTLTWQKECATKESITNGKWVIFRKSPDGTLEILGTKAYSTCKFVDVHSSDNELSYDATYTYYVAFQPNKWNTDLSTYEDAADLWVSTDVTIKRDFAIDLEATGGESDIQVDWTYNPTFQNASSGNSYTVELYRSVNEETPVKVQTFSVTNPQVTTGTYTDTDVESGCKTYGYYVKTYALDSTWVSDTKAASISGRSKVTRVEASRGNYNGTVKIYWNATQVGTGLTYYDVYRRPLGSTDGGDWAKIYATSGTATSYSYDDNTALPGSYYEYEVQSYSQCGDAYTTPESKYCDGFSLATGVVSGRVFFETGTAVEGVRVSATSDNAEQGAAFYGMRLAGEGAGIQYADSAAVQSLLNAKDFSVQMYVNPSDSMLEVSNYYKIMSVPDAFDLSLSNYDEMEGVYSLYLGNEPTDLLIPQNVYSHITLSYDYSAKQAALYMINNEDSLTVDTISNYSITLASTSKTLNLGCEDTNAYTGYVDEFRLFSGKALTQAEVLSNYNHTLAGSETGLSVYWPFDEGIERQVYAYDYSKKSGVLNGRHGTLMSNTSSSKVIPTADQLGLSAVTDTLGNYVIRGIPFSPDGSNYTIRASKGVHDFSPSSTTRYLSDNSLVHSSVDFTDISSFEVSGVIYYENTTYPVSEVTLYVDGVACTKDGALVQTDENGEFTIDVPIGNHYITVEKEGHTFAYEGRFPEKEDGKSTLYSFVKEMTGLTFYDQTLVPIVGRVSGGPVENEYPLGMGLSNNNIGQARITLTCSDTYRMNVKKVQDEASIEYVYNPSDTTYVIPEGAYVNSVTTVGGGSDENTRIITILTDPNTGEFAAMVPPVVYTVTGIELVNNSSMSWNDQEIIDASDVTEVYTDSAEIDGSELTFSYVASLKKSYRSVPTMTVTQSDALCDGAFGEAEYSVTKDDGTEITQALYDVEGDFSNIPIQGVTDELDCYTYGYPIFIEGAYYDFDFSVYEEYTNADDGTTERVPLEGVEVEIGNEMGSGSAVYIKDSVDVSAGSVYVPEENVLELDENGAATYRWMAGMPNIQDPYTRTMTVTYITGNTELSWEGSGFTGIVLGCFPTGSNFVTGGPDEVLMVLRDPPGSGSSAYVEEGTTVTRNISKSTVFTSENSVGGSVAMGTKVTNYAGSPFLGVITTTGFEITTNVGVNVNVEHTGSNSVTEEITTTKSISTSDQSDYVGADGDVFIGTSTNYIFGNARQVGLYVNAAGDGLDLGMNDVLSVTTDFGTSFSYTQNYVKNTLIPNLKLLRNSVLETKTQDAYNNYTNNTDEPKYITLLSENDPLFGSNNDDEAWGANAATTTLYDGPSYKLVLPSGYNKVSGDTIRWFNNQIAGWEKVLYNNEKAKVTAIENREEYLNTNLSFDSGAAVSMSTHTSGSEEYTSETSCITVAVVGVDSEFEAFGQSVTVSASTNTGGGTVSSTTESTTNEKEVGFSLVEDGSSDALSVDVYNAPDGFGPIFYTRGGQTSCPYEDEVVTEYFQPGTVISTKTMQVEQPHITASVTSLTGVPSGKAATFDITLQNTSETNEDIWYNISVVDTSNPDGADVRIDGESIVRGRTILVPAGSPTYKTLQIWQTDENITQFDSLQIVLSSQCEDAIADTLELSVSYQRTCSDVAISSQESTINKSTGTSMHLTISGYNVNYESLESVTLQVQQVGDPNWTNIVTWTNGDDLDVNGTFDYVFDMSNSQTFPDGDYYIRAITNCNYANVIVNNESNEIAFTKDISRPQLIANASPTDGVLNAGDEISLTFNEDIRYGAITKADNFTLKGELNDAKIDHNVALNLTAGDPAKTESRIDLSNRSFAINMWLKYSAAGHILTHGATGNRMDVSVNASNKLVVDVNGNTYTSLNALQKNTWMFLSLAYDADEEALNATYAYDSYEVDLFNSKAIGEYTGNGSLALGEGLTGQIHEVTLWNYARTWSEANSERTDIKNRYTDGLMGYWKLNEGHGATATDYSRNRTMALPSSTAWHLENTNYAMELDGTQAAAVSVSSCGTADEESYLLELWFRADSEGNTSDASIVSMGTDALDIRLNSAGAMVLVATGTEMVASKTDYRDNQWHHLALNALKSSNGNATLYVDGVAVKSVSASIVPAIQADYLFLGAHRGSVYTDQFLKGAVDEVRLWTGRRTADVIRNNMYSRVDEDDSQLLAYYPLEYTTTDSGNQPIQYSTLADQSSAQSGDITLFNTTGSFTMQSSNVPALKAAPTKTNVGFTFVGSDRKILINLTDDAPLLENCTVSIKVKGVRDAHNNSCEEITWDVYVRQNQLTWADDEATVRKEGSETATFTVDIVNGGSTSESWALSNMPAWLSVDSESGTLLPLSTKTLTFTVDPSTAAGRYENTIYLTGSLGIDEPLVVSLTSAVEAPDWVVNTEDYEYSMSVIGQLVVDGAYSEDAEDMVGAFNGNTCVGVAHPTYLSRYDTYYLMMTIYGNEEDFDSPLTFKVFDASTGTIYPVVDAKLNDVVQDITFYADDLIGSLATPLVFEPSTTIEQTLTIRKGWTWASIYVTPTDPQLSAIFADNGTTISYVKTKDAYSQLNTSGQWKGELTTMTPGSMYKLNSSAATTTSVLGTPVKPDETSLTIASGWNWIGYNCSSTANLATAFADLNPEEGDMVKGQSSFSVYTSGEWVGTLSMLTPGLGYCYNSLASGQKTFCYPSISNVNSNAAPRKMQETFVNADYDGNMTMIAVVKDGDRVISDAQVYVYGEQDLRTYSEQAVRDDIHFLTIAGNQNGDVLRFVVTVDGYDYFLVQTENYQNDAMYGTYAAPYELHIDGATGINSLMADGEDTIYDVAGRKLQQIQQNHGVYIVNGQKVVK